MFICFPNSYSRTKHLYSVDTALIILPSIVFSQYLCFILPVSFSITFSRLFLWFLKGSLIDANYIYTSKHYTNEITFFFIKGMFKLSFTYVECLHNYRSFGYSTGKRRHLNTLKHNITNHFNFY